MTVSELKEYIANVIRMFSDADIEITEETRLVDDIGLASMNAMAILSEFESELGINIPVSAVSKVETVGDLNNVIINILKE